jgi:diaminohydroxyphosphoribosylaminopyrimidine deaminase/5-amino-6-(5-phosphoribosylamino)uracil reductase
MAAIDAHHMAAALSLARRGLGRVWPNPAVGCVIVKDGIVVGRGWTQPGGRPHAESEALAMAREAARGATAYVTLEPCAHHGQTPPCAQALASAGLARVVVATGDPDPRVDGGGIEALRAAGIAVETGLLEVEAQAVNAGFLSRIERGRPFVQLKVASTLDGRIATHSGASHWITSQAARAWGHRLRATADAVMIGSGTALADDPVLTCRLPGMEDRSPVRVVMDRRLRLPLTAKLVQTAAVHRTILITGDRAAAERLSAFEMAGIEVLALPDGEAGVAPDTALEALAGLGLTRVLVEGGSHLAAALVRADLVDEIRWFRAPSLIGGDGLAALTAFGIDTPDAARRYTRVAAAPVGDDLAEVYIRA